MFSADGEPLLVLTSGAHRVDTAKVAAELGVAKVGRADPEFVYARTGQRIGGVAPVGHPRPVRTLVDTALQAYDVVWAAAGHVHTVFPTTFAELVLITAVRPPMSASATLGPCAHWSSSMCRTTSAKAAHWPWRAGPPSPAAITAYLSGPAGERYDYVVATQDFHRDPGAHFSAHPTSR